MFILFVVDEDLESVMNFLSKSFVSALSILHNLRLSVTQVILNFHSSKVLLRLGERSFYESGAGDGPTGCFCVAFRSADYCLILFHE